MIGELSRLALAAAITGSRHEGGVAELGEKLDKLANSVARRIRWRVVTPARPVDDWVPSEWWFSEDVRRTEQMKEALQELAERAAEAGKRTAFIGGSLKEELDRLVDAAVEKIGRPASLAEILAVP